MPLHAARSGFPETSPTHAMCTRMSSDEVCHATFYLGDTQSVHSLGVVIPNELGQTQQLRHLKHQHQRRTNLRTRRRLLSHKLLNVSLNVGLPRNAEVTLADDPCFVYEP